MTLGAREWRVPRRRQGRLRVCTRVSAIESLLDEVFRTPDTATGTGMHVLEIVLRLVESDSGGTAAAGTAVAASGWGGWHLIRRVAPVGVALYARIAKLDLAKHPARAKLLAAIRAQEGATTRELIAITALKNGTALHHLRTLERGGLVRSRRLGRDRAWTDAAAGRADASVLAALHAPTRQRILDLAGRQPGITQAELARALGFARATVHHHIEALRGAGLLDVRRAGLRKGCFPRASAMPGTGP